MNTIRDPSLAAQGQQKIDWAASHMPVLNRIAARFQDEKPFDGLTVALSIHLEAKTANLALCLQAGGAQVAITGCNPLSTQDDVAAALAALGPQVHALWNATDDEYDDHLKAVLATRPHLVLDDGGDLTNLLHGRAREYGDRLMGITEETTTGVLRARARAQAGALWFPLIAVNDADCKHLFDNRYGTGQSTWESIMHTTNVQVSGKTVVVAGYGWCGRGVAMRAAGLGAHVIVTEIDPVKAIEAVMDGFRVLPMNEAAPLGDFFITVTGCKDVIIRRHMEQMKDGAILCNAGHFDVEISKSSLKAMSVRTWARRRNITGYELPDGRILNLLAQGRLVNLASGNGHPAEIMDMSFALQALTLEYLARDGKNMPPDVYKVPIRIDRAVASGKLASLNVSVDALTPEQEEYLRQYE